MEEGISDLTDGIGVFLVDSVFKGINWRDIVGARAFVELLLFRIAPIYISASR